jgi:hypothetical protein
VPDDEFGPGCRGGQLHREAGGRRPAHRLKHGRLVDHIGPLEPSRVAGAATLALDARRRLGRLPSTAIAALVLAALVTVTAVWVAFTG